MQRIMLILTALRQLPPPPHKNSILVDTNSASSPSSNPGSNQPHDVDLILAFSPSSTTGERRQQNKLGQSGTNGMKE